MELPNRDLFTPKKNVVMIEEEIFPLSLFGVDDDDNTIE